MFPLFLNSLSVENFNILGSISILWHTQHMFIFLQINEKCILFIYIFTKGNINP